MKPRLTLVLALFIFALPVASFAQTCTAAGPNSGTASDVSSTGSHAWGNPANAQASDNQYASVTVSLAALGSTTTHYLVLDHLGFSIPTGNTICGVVVEIERQTGGIIVGGSISDNIVKLVKGGAVSGNNLAQGNWPSSDNTASYGNSANLLDWGVSLSQSDVNASNFGVAISAKLAAVLGLSMTASIDNIQVTVYSKSASLAITLQKFSASAAGSVNRLDWTAFSDSPATDTFFMQRSPDGRAWKDMDWMKPLWGTHDYKYFDESPFAGISYYRLRLKTGDKSSTYSPIDQVGRDLAQKISIYPNPVAGNTLSFTSSGITIQRILLRDLQGRILQSFKGNADNGNPGSAGTGASGGSYSQSLSLEGLSPGIYLLQADEKVFKIFRQ